MTALDLLRKYQFTSCCYACIGCKRMHREGCAPDCEVAAILAKKRKPKRAPATAVGSGNGRDTED